MSKISVVVPVFNVEKYLERCINSLVNQTLRDIEIILVDDQSPDKCPEICDEWAKKDSRISVIHKKNGGLGNARNSGLDVAMGEFVTFLDSDDYVELDAYEKLYEVAKKKNLDICYFKHRRLTDDGLFIEVEKDNRPFFFFGREDVDAFMLNIVGVDPTEPIQGHFSMSVCMGIFRLETVKKSGVRFISEREVASEDLVFDINYLPNVERVGVLPDVYYNYFINPSSISTSYSEGKYQRMIKLLNVVKDALLKNFTWNQIKLHYYSQQLRIIKIVMRYESQAKVSLSEKIRRINRCCDEAIFEDLYKDKAVSKYSIKDRCIVRFMKHRLALPIILIYKRKR